MALNEQQILQLLQQIVTRLNEIADNSKVTEEMPLMSNINRNALLRLSVNGNSYKTKLQSIIDEIANDLALGNVPVEFMPVQVSFTTTGNTANKIRIKLNEGENYVLQQGTLYIPYVRRIVLSNGNGFGIASTPNGTTFAVITEYYFISQRINPDVNGLASIGQGGTEILPGGIRYFNTVDNRSFAPIDFQLGDIASATISSAVNGSGPYSTPHGTTVLFNATQDGVEKTWLYRGNQEEAGLGKPPLTEDDFRLFPQDGEDTDPPPTFQETKPQDASFAEIATLNLDNHEVLYRYMNAPTDQDVFTTRRIRLGGKVKMLINRTAKTDFPKIKNKWLVKMNGGTGTANIVIEGSNYNIEATDGTTPMESIFVTTYGATILSNHSLSVIYNPDGFLEFDGLGNPAISVSNITGTLTGTVKAIPAVMIRTADFYAAVFEMEVEYDGWQINYSFSTRANGGFYKPYPAISAMLADQTAQTNQQVVEVADASGDNNITFKSGETKFQAYYRFNGTATGSIDDYTLISAPYGNHTTALTNTFFATDYGTSDADISLGSTSFGTDSLTGLQAMLDEALTRPILIYWDGKFSVSGVLEVHSNTTIIALAGCGVILRNHSNSYLIKNKNTVDPSATGGWNSNIVDENIIIENMILNGNGYNTGTGGSDVFDTDNNGSAVNGSAQTKRNQIIDFTGVKNFQLNNLQLLGGRYWATHFANIKDSFINDLLIDFGDSSTRDNYNYDGVHIKGGSDNIKLKNIICRNTKDDNIALNSYSQLAIYIPQRGPITNIEMDGVHLDGRAMGIGLYSEIAPSKIDNILIKNVTGVTQSHWMRITNGEGGTRDGDGIFGSIIVENVTVNVVNGNNIQDFDGLINVRANVDKLILRNIVRSDFEKNNAYICLSEADSKIDELIIDGVQMETTGGTWNKPFLKVDAGQIKRCLISNYIHNEITSRINSPVVEVNGGYLAKLMMNNINCSNINIIFNHTGGTVDGIFASNIGNFQSLAAGFKTTETIGRIFLSNYDGDIPLSGTFSKKRGSSLDYLGEYLFADLLDASDYSGSMVSITDETDGYTRAYSDGVNWLRVYDNAIADGPTGSGYTITLSEDFTGTSVDTGKGSIINPDVSNIAVKQDDKIILERITDTAVPNSLTNGWASSGSFSKGSSVAVLINRDIGFTHGYYTLRWVFNGTTDFISLQGTSVPNEVRIIIRKASSFVYDQTFSMNTDKRFKIYYSLSNEISFWQWVSGAWAQIGTTQTYDVGGSGTLLLTSNSIPEDEIGDKLSFDQLRVVDADYTTELP